MEMKTRLLLVPLCLAAVAALAAGCGGGGGSVSADAVARVGSTSITKATFSDLMQVGAANFLAHGQKPPKVGTPQYTQLKQAAVVFLVQQEELRQEGEKVGVTVSQKDIDARVAQIRATHFNGSQKKLDAALKKNHITLAQYEKYELLPQLLPQKIYDKVTASVKVSKADAKAYYNQNKATTFSTPETRDVRHILVKTKSLAEKLEAQLAKTHGANFAKLAKRYSTDTSSAQHGGKLCVSHLTNSGACIATVPPFDKAAFSLKTHEISQPVHSTFGWHIIQALSPVRPAHTQPFSQVYPQIQQTLLTQKKGQVWSTWLAKLKTDFQGKVHYQTGYAPPTTSVPSTGAGTTTVPPATTG
jgi:parvulin-like peptidyl-prolyl isomerase